MSTVQLQASQRFLDAMGPMIADEEKMQEIISFILNMRHSEKTDFISDEEIAKCLTLDAAFDKLRQNIINRYESRQ